MTRFDPRKGVLARHVGHPLQGVDVRSVRCTSCAVLLLLDANREAPDEHQAPARVVEGAQLPACRRCGRRVRHVNVDGLPEPMPHASISSGGARLCSEPTAQLPPGGWRELVERLHGEPAPVEGGPLGLSAQHDAPGVASQGVDTSTTRRDRAADAATSSVGAPQHQTRGT